METRCMNPPCRSTALPKTLEGWLNRPKKVKGKRIPAMSDKRKVENREYLKKRKAFLIAHPLCVAYNRIKFFLQFGRLGGIPGEDWFVCSDVPASTEIHHTKKPKQTYYLDERTWRAVCRWSHDWIENHKSEARRLGLLK